MSKTANELAKHHTSLAIERLVDIIRGEDSKQALEACKLLLEWGHVNPATSKADSVSDDDELSTYTGKYIKKSDIQKENAKKVTKVGTFATPGAPGMKN
jgi:hypothetical protein